MATTLRSDKLKRFVCGSRGAAVLLASLATICAVVALLPFVANELLRDRPIDVVFNAAGKDVEVNGRHMDKWECISFLCADWNKFGYARDVRLSFASGSDVSELCLFGESDNALQQERKCHMAKNQGVVSFTLFFLNDLVDMPKTGVVLSADKEGRLSDKCYALNEVAFWRWREWAVENGVCLSCVCCRKELYGSAKVQVLNLKDVLEKRGPCPFSRVVLLLSEKTKGKMLFDLVEKCAAVADSLVMVSVSSYDFDGWVRSGVCRGNE